MTATEQLVLWVRSDVLPGGSYGVSLSAGEDRAWSLTPQEAAEYAGHCHEVATTAEHDAAMVSLLLTVGGPRRDVAVLLRDLRNTRGHSPSPWPVQFAPQVSQRGPFVRVELDGHEVGQLTPAELREHGSAVLSARTASALDAAAYRLLAGEMGLDDATARAVIGSLARHWPGATQ